MRMPKYRATDIYISLGTTAKVNILASENPLNLRREFSLLQIPLLPFLLLTERMTKK